MATSTPSFTAKGAQDRSVGDRAILRSSRRTGNLVLLLAFLVTITRYLLQTRLTYPAILLDSASLASALVAQGEIIDLLSFVGFLLCGGLILIISLKLASDLEDKRRRYVTLLGGACGVSWAVGALLGLVLVPLWGIIPPVVAQILAMLIQVTVEIATPLLLIFWTLTLARQFRAYRVLGWISAIGFILTIGRTLLWDFNTLLPIESRFYAISGALSVFTLLGEAFWLLWLALLGFRLRAFPTTQAQPFNKEVPASKGHVVRRAFLKGGARLGAGFIGLAFVAARTSLTVINQPDLEGDDIPSEPSFISILFYMSSWFFLKLIHPVHTIAQQLQVAAISVTPPPANVTIEQVDAGGVPAQRITAPGAVNTHWILYVHGGGFAQAGTNDSRAFVGKLSKFTGASGLYPDYRLTPKHPFPAGLNDCLTAYRWLRSQGVAASHIALAGESAGANLAMAIALSLKENGEEVPSALIALSAPTDMTMAGETYRTKALTDPILGSGLAQDAFALYTNHGETDPRNPLVSPLYADLRGFPPTLLQVGTLEVLLSDSINMAGRLKAAGVETKLEVWPGMMHAFTSGTDSIPEARLATKHVVKFLLRHWAV